ncbi:hypothetical protein MRS44_012591 [Fusarium solani]|uniref:uncharacterized protein n=1 Tax=Fusarium solani TaxID=169388 RepID=UPI0032C45DCE|nr:hypothetical protein MRS44_012591 [Fusarium solani]
MSHVPLAVPCLTCSRREDVHQQLVGWREDKLKLGQEGSRHDADAELLLNSCTPTARTALRQGRCGAYHEEEEDEKQDEIGDRDSDSPLQWTLLSLFYLSPHIQSPVHHKASTTAPSSDNLAVSEPHLALPRLASPR